VNYGLIINQNYLVWKSWMSMKCFWRLLS
jgi:hypothetical protein